MSSVSYMQEVLRDHTILIANKEFRCDVKYFNHADYSAEIEYYINTLEWECDVEVITHDQNWYSKYLVEIIRCNVALNLII